MICFIRHNLLGSLQKDSMAISLHDMQQSLEEAEPSALERTVHPGQGNIHLASFSWHPTHENRLLAISQTGQICLKFLVVYLLNLSYYYRCYE